MWGQTFSKRRIVCGPRSIKWWVNHWTIVTYRRLHGKRSLVKKIYGKTCLVVSDQTLFCVEYFTRHFFVELTLYSLDAYCTIILEKKNPKDNKENKHQNTKEITIFWFIHFFIVFMELVNRWITISSQSTIN